MLERVPGSPRSIAVLRALHMGDLLCAIPALRALRARYPEAHVALVGLASSEELVARYPHLLDELVVLPEYLGLPETVGAPGSLAQFLADMRSRRFDVAVQMHGDGSIVNALVHAFGAGVTVGCHPVHELPPKYGSFVRYRSDVHEVQRCLHALAPLEVQTSDATLEFTVHPEDVQAWRRLAARFGVGAPFVAVHAGARARARRWPAARMAATIDALAGRGLKVVLTGSADEADIAQLIAERTHVRVVDLVGRTNLGALAALLSEAALLITNDTGVSHLAAALGTPSVVIFTASDPVRWAPLDAERHRVVHGGALGQGRYAPASVEAVLAAAVAQLGIDGLDAGTSRGRRVAA